METVFYSVDTKQITCRMEAEQKASGAGESVRCVVVPQKGSALPRKGGTVVEFSRYCHSTPPVPGPEDEEEKEQQDPEKKRDRGAMLSLVLDVCATAAILAVTALIVVRFWLF